MSRSGDMQNKLTAETRRHGENRKGSDFANHPITCDQQITRSLYLCHPEGAGAHATASRRTPALSVSRHTASGSSYETLKDLLPRFKSAMQTLRATLREIFDESAYDRFLLRTHASRSTASYCAFTRERDAAMLKKPRCC